MTAATITPSARRSIPQWRSALGYLLSGYVYMLTLWFWAIALPVVAIIMFIIGQNTDQVTSSGVAFTFHGALWFPFSVAIILSVTYLPIHVANGMTRRSFSRAAIAVNVIVGLINAVIAVLALLVERVIYDRLGWVHGGNDGEGIPVFQGGVLTYGLGLAAIFIAGQVSGSLIGVAYYRLGGIRGTLALPLCLVPLGAMGLLGLGRSVQWNPWGWTAEIAPWGSIGAVLILLLAAGVFHLLVRDIPIDSKD